MNFTRPETVNIAIWSYITAAVRIERKWKMRWLDRGNRRKFKGEDLFIKLREDENEKKRQEQEKKNKEQKLVEEDKKKTKKKN